MKQHIGPSQLAELSDEQKEKLRQWWEPQKGDMVSRGSESQLCVGVDNNNLYFERESSKHYFAYLPLLSIGQCIELLDSYLTYLKLSEYSGQWEVRMFSVPGVSSHGMGRLPCSFSADDLIDALWQAVKEVI